MLAASYWSLLAPAIELAQLSGGYGSLAFVPVGVGFLAGAVFVYIADWLLPLMVCVCMCACVCVLIILYWGGICLMLPVDHTLHMYVCLIDNFWVPKFVVVCIQRDCKDWLIMKIVMLVMVTQTEDGSPPFHQDQLIFDVQVKLCNLIWCPTLGLIIIIISIISKHFNYSFDYCFGIIECCMVHSWCISHRNGITFTHTYICNTCNIYMYILYKLAHT